MGYGIGDTGVSTSRKVPGYVARILFAAGALSAGAFRLSCLLVGMKTSAGSMTVDSDVLRVTSEDEVNAYAGIGSQLARMAYKALTIPTLELWIAAVTEPGAGTAGTVTCVLAGTVSSGTIRLRMAGTSIIVNVASTMALDDVGAAVVTAFNAKSKLPATAAYDAPSGTLTFTLRNKGASGRFWLLYHDPTDKPSALTLTFTGSSTINTYGFYFGAAGTGTGAEDVTTLLTKLLTRRYARIALGHNDATNAALWESHVNTKAGPTSLLLDQLVFAVNGAWATALSLAQTTLNAYRASVIWMRNGESHPCEIASLVAATRAVAEQSVPVTDYDGMILSNLAPHADISNADAPTDAEQDLALNSGVTPLTTVNNEVRIVRMITSYCLLSAGVQDERCLDIGDPTVTDFIAIDTKLYYDTVFRVKNPYVGPNPAEGEDPPPAMTAYPDLWRSELQSLFDGYYDRNMLEDRPVGAWAPICGFNRTGRFITADTSFTPRQLQHRIDNVFRQTKNIG